MNTDLNYLLTRVVSSTAKIGFCAIAPLASHKMFHNNANEVYADAVREVVGVSTPKINMFIGCAINVLAQDAIDILDWTISNDIPQKIVNYVAGDLNRFATNQSAFSDTYVENNIPELIQHDFAMHHTE